MRNGFLIKQILTRDSPEYTSRTEAGFRTGQRF